MRLNKSNTKIQTVTQSQIQSLIKDTDDNQTQIPEKPLQHNHSSQTIDSISKDIDINDNSRSDSLSESDPESVANVLSLNLSHSNETTNTTNLKQVQDSDSESDVSISKFTINRVNTTNESESDSDSVPEGYEPTGDPEQDIYLHGLYPRNKEFREKVDCDFRRPEWQQYRHVYELSMQQESQRPLDVKGLLYATRILSSVLWARSRNVTDVLTCTTGVISGYQRLAHALLISGLGSTRTALYRYRLLQLGLIFIFTLRNANKIPVIASQYWASSEQYIIPNIMAIRRHVENLELQKRKDREHFTGRTIDSNFRDYSMRIAIVSICAYPESSDIALKDVTPLNRELYTRRHGYELRLHTEPPIVGGNVQIQHAKLATVNHYIRSGEFDWVVWLDCDSLIMNLEMTIESVIYRAAGIWSSNSFAGEWKDTWDEGLIKIEVNETKVVANAPQFGMAYGEMKGQILSMSFSNIGTPLTATLESAPDGDILQWSNGAIWHRTRKIEPCKQPGIEHCPELKGLDDGINLLITEEGWGLSSANWMVRRSPWTIQFLDQALDIAHVRLPLFGDQDALIYLLMNHQTLRGLTDTLDHTLDDDDNIHNINNDDINIKQHHLNHGAGLIDGFDPLDPHCKVVPQRELNAYDHLNAYTMQVQGYQFGDFLVTFPQCKDSSCNAMFRLAAEYAHEREEFAYNPHDWVHVRLFGPRNLLEIWWKKHLEEREREKSQQYSLRDKDGEEEGEEEDLEETVEDSDSNEIQKQIKDIDISNQNHQDDKLGSDSSKSESDIGLIQAETTQNASNKTNDIDIVLPLSEDSQANETQTVTSATSTKTKNVNNAGGQKPKKKSKNQNNGSKSKSRSRSPSKKPNRKRKFRRKPKSDIIEDKPPEKIVVRPGSSNSGTGSTVTSDSETKIDLGESDFEEEE